MAKGAGKWKVEYEDSYYKVYDWDSRLSGYFFPHYQGENDDSDDDIIEELNKKHAQLAEGTLLVPMLRLDLLDSEGAISLGDVISSLESGKSRASKWEEWLGKNASSLGIRAAGAHTAREDRNMLSIALALHGTLTLGEKEVLEFLRPVLDRLHVGGLL